MGAIHPRGILLGLAVFAVLYIGGTFLANVTVRLVADPHSALRWLNPLAFLTWVLSGYVCAMIAKSRGAVNGAVFGALSIAVVAVAQSIFGGNQSFYSTLVEDYYYWIILGVILGGFGGLLGDVYRKFKNKSL
ncbi:hypothetical protein SVA_2949 [Sulfurifustis variabilis]|uniref:Uncharacterized protein n=1 Tax=Sulfurifustis variabilis TaxID=1675686 RepID=A0A1B4VFI0_9GAMM|nr:hypothetical protein [Sulfurifustis variabilis]BAU49497.1 hypothetical protein SVA_2949 [Sulfurifustis variabilis]